MTFYLVPALPQIRQLSDSNITSGLTEGITGLTEGTAEPNGGTTRGGDK